MTSFFQNSIDGDTQVPANFIKLAELDILIAHCQLESNEPVTLDVVSPINRHSNVGLLQDGKIFASLYTHFDYTKAIYHMLSEPDNVNYYRMSTSYQNKLRDKCLVKVDFYIKREYLLEIYTLQKTPLIVYKLINSLYDKSLESIIINEAKSFPTDNSIKSEFLREPFYYQMENFSWMMDLERKVDNNSLNYTTFITDFNRINLKCYHLEELNDNLVFNTLEKKIINSHNLPTDTFNFKGGILADNIGLGKSFSIIGLINLSKKEGDNPTLILSPKRICNQWKDEINKSTNLTCYVITSITNLKKLTISSLTKYDVIIFNYNLFTNKNYLNYCETNSSNDNENQNCLLPEEFKWKRIVLDEGHEYINCGPNFNKNYYNQTVNHLYNLKSNYRWICSGTPYSNIEDFWKMISYLTNCQLEYHNLDYLNDHILNLLYKTPGWVDSKYNYLFVSNNKLEWCLIKGRFKNPNDIDYHNITNQNFKIIQELPVSEWKYIYYDKSHNKNLSKIYKSIYNCLNGYIGHSKKDIETLLIRKNTKKRVEAQVKIEKPIIKTEFLDMSKIERAIYLSALGDIEKQFQFCNHVQVSEKHLKILGQELLPLDEVHTIMVSYYQKQVLKEEKRMVNLQKQINKYKDKLNIEYGSDNDDNCDNSDNGGDEESGEFENDINVYDMDLELDNNVEQLENSEYVEDREKEDEINNSDEIEDLVKDEETEIENSEELLERLKETQEKYLITKDDLANNKYRLGIFQELSSKLEEEIRCPICLEDFDTLIKSVTTCGHFICGDCLNQIAHSNETKKIKCPMCKTDLNTQEDIQFICNDDEGNNKVNEKLGTKISYLINATQEILNADDNNRIIIFSQWDNMLKLISDILLNESLIKNVVLKGNYHVINNKLRKFKLSDDHRVILLSGEKAASGLTLTEASHIFLVDTLSNQPDYCRSIEEQAIGRAVRIGQKKKVKVIRLVMKDTVESDFYQKYQEASKDELISEAVFESLSENGLNNSLIQDVNQFL